jgi:hypothetical protein
LYEVRAPARQKKKLTEERPLYEERAPASLHSRLRHVLVNPAALCGIGFFLNSMFSFFPLH